jgi:pyrroloquinoline quinone (PQQ) biosynthesis protein C
MHIHGDTEPIFARVDRYRSELLRHPLLTPIPFLAELPTPILVELAYHQYSDSILWIPMLAQMLTKSERSPRLRRAIADNIADEAGLSATSHVELARRLMRSLGVRDLGALPHATLADTASMWLSDAFAAMSEPEIAGFLLAAETLVPALFAAVQPHYARACADDEYFRVHVAIDSDDHARWMAEAVAEVIALYGDDAAPLIVRGVDDAWRETIEIPDALWRSLCASR